MGVTVKDIDHGWNDIVKATKKLRGSHTKVGLFGQGDESVNLAARATTLEYGSRSGKIPERPFNRQAFDNNIKQITAFMKKEYNKLLNKKGKVNPRKLLSNIGEWFTGEIKEAITHGNFTALKPLTVLRKGSSKPLIDTGQMRASITHKEILR